MDIQNILTKLLLFILVLNSFSGALADLYAGYDDYLYGSGDYEISGDTNEVSGDTSFICGEFNPCQQQCIKLDTIEACFCDRGFKINPDKQTCSDINECDFGNGDCQHLCTNTHGSYYCTCSLGFKRGNDGLVCHDVDECEEGFHNCEQKCHNLVGGFSCDCEKGYYLADNSTECRKELFKLSLTDESTLILAGALTAVGIIVMIIFLIIFTTALYFIRRIGMEHPYSKNTFI